MSYLNSALTVIGICIVFAPISVFLLPKVYAATPVGAVSLFILEFAIAILLWQKLATGWTEWTFDKRGINIEWAKAFAFRSDKSITILWSDMERCESFGRTITYDAHITITTKKRRPY
jgi:hypothetical protein